MGEFRNEEGGRERTKEDPSFGLRKEGDEYVLLSR